MNIQRTATGSVDAQQNAILVKTAMYPAMARKLYIIQAQINQLHTLDP